MGRGGVPVPKGKTRKQIKAKKDRLEAKVKRAVRAECVERDGHCRLTGTTLCDGPSEWAHLESRAKTRGMASDRRHSTNNSIMACRKHHQMQHAGLLKIYLTDAGGANAALDVLVDGQLFRV